MVKIPPTGIALEDIERHALIEALKMSNWVQKDAAELLSISPRVMNYKIKTLGDRVSARPPRRAAGGCGELTHDRSVTKLTKGTKIIQATAWWFSCLRDPVRLSNSNGHDGSPGRAIPHCPNAPPCRS